MTRQHPIPTSAPCPTGTQTHHPGLPNTEKLDLADQKAAARLERIESFLHRLLDQFQGVHRTRRLFKRLETQARASLRRAKAQLKKLLAHRGIQVKGFEFRGVRRALPPIRLAASAAALGKIPPYG